MRTLACLLLAAALAPTASALLPITVIECANGVYVAPQCPEWQARHDRGEAEDEGNAIVASPDGTLAFTAGAQHGAGSYFDFDALVLAREVATGKLVWSATVATAAAGPDRFFDVTVSPDGARVFAVGSAHDEVGSQFHLDTLVAAFDAADGSTLWTARLDLGMHEIGKAVAASPDGAAVYVAGFAADSWADSQAVVLGLDAATGAVLWQDQFDGGHGDYNGATDVGVSADGALVVATGQIRSRATWDYVTVAYGAADGERAWEARYDGDGHRRDGAHALAIDGARVYVTGSSVGTLDTWGDIATVAYDLPTGAQLWAARYNGQGNHYDGGDAVVVADGRVFTAGIARGAGQLIQAIALAHDADTGEMLWVAPYAPLLTGPVTSFLNSAVASEDGLTLYVAGHQRGRDRSTDPLVAAYDTETGAMRWHSGWSPGGRTWDTAEDIALAGGFVLTAGTGGAGEVSIASDGGGADHNPPAEEDDGDVLNLAFAA